MRKQVWSIIISLGIAGCAGITPKGQQVSPPKPGQPTPTPQTSSGAPTTGQPPRQTIIYIPQTDQAVGSWLKLFEKHSNLRMVIAISPRFQRFAKEAPLKERLLALQKERRLEMALQLPNAPFLPLLINTDSA